MAVFLLSSIQFLIDVSIFNFRLIMHNFLLTGYYWCQTSGGEIPPTAIKVGVDKDGGDIYMGRATHNGDLLPAKVIPNHNCAYIAYDGEEHRKDEYEVCQSF